MATTVTIDNSRPEAKALIEYLRTLDFVEVTSEDETKEDYSLCYSVEEMDSMLDQVLVEIKEGKGIDHKEVFKNLMATFDNED